MKAHVLLLAIVYLASIAGCTSSQLAPPQVKPSHPVKGSVQFRPSGQQMVVEAVVDQRVKVNFLVDTGASLTMIPSAAAIELGINLNARLPTVPVQTVSNVIHVPLVVLGSVEVGGMEVKNLTVAVYDIPIFDLYLPGPPGLLGRDFLGNFRVQVDLNQGILLLEEKSFKSN
jgi:clan AA aspartic protease (TIGR02281 family)